MRKVVFQNSVSQSIFHYHVVPMSCETLFYKGPMLPAVPPAKAASMAPAFPLPRSVAPARRLRGARPPRRPASAPEPTPFASQRPMCAILAPARRPAAPMAPAVVRRVTRPAALRARPATTASAARLAGSVDRPVVLWETSVSKTESAAQAVRGVAGGHYHLLPD
jgi:hypothetical protein